MCTDKSPRDLIEMQILVQWVWWGSAFLMSS